MYNLVQKFIFNGLKYNSHTIHFTNLKFKIQRHLEHTQMCVSITIYFRRLSSLQKIATSLSYHSPTPGAPNPRKLESIFCLYKYAYSLWHKWNNEICGPLWLASCEVLSNAFTFISDVSFLCVSLSPNLSFSPAKGLSICWSFQETNFGFFNSLYCFSIFYFFYLCSHL